MKSYVKPDFLYENFELSQNVAACTYDLNQADKNVCGFKGDVNEGADPDVVIFASPDICAITDFESYCEELASSNMSTFNS